MMLGFLSLLAVCGLSAGTGDPLLIAHRGLAGQAPENTLAAYAAAVELGLGIELDVYMTTDGHLVVIHDPKVNRTTNGKGDVKKMTLEQVRALDAGSWFHPCFAGLKVPTLEEVFKLVKDRQRVPSMIALNMKDFTPGIEEKIARLVEQYGLLDQLFAFDMPVATAERFRKANPKLKTAISVSNSAKFKESLGSSVFDDIWLHFIPSKEEVAEAHAKGKRLWLWDFAMPPQEKLWDLFKKAKEVGLDGVCTDHPSEARRLWGWGGKRR